MASDEAQDFGMRMINRFDVDWACHGYDDAALHELVEFTLRTMLSFFVAPNPPGRSREELRHFIKRWLGGAISAQADHRARAAAAGGVICSTGGVRRGTPARSPGSSASRLVADW